VNAETAACALCAQTLGSVKEIAQLNAATQLPFLILRLSGVDLSQGWPLQLSGDVLDQCVHIDLTNCGLSALPDPVKSARKLRILELAGNPLSEHEIDSIQQWAIKQKLIYLELNQAEQVRVVKQLGNDGGFALLSVRASSIVSRAKSACQTASHRRMCFIVPVFVAYRLSRPFMVARSLARRTPANWPWRWSVRQWRYACGH